MTAPGTLPGMTNDVVGCLACDLTSGRRPVPGGELFAAGGWRIEHCVGPLGAGTLIVKPLRHVVHVADRGAAGAAADNPGLAAGFNVVAGKVTYEPVAEATGQAYTPLFDVLEERAAA